MDFTIERLEFYLLIIVRISAFVAVAPFYSLSSVPQRVKAGLAVFLGLMMVSMVPYTPLEYYGVIGYAMLVMEEAIAGLLIGYVAQLCTYIISFSGHLIDMEIGFSMVSELDPSTKIQTTITGNFYSYMVMFMLMITNMYYYILSALFDSFRLIPIGEVLLKRNLYEIMAAFMGDYFVIGFRIVLPIFAATLLINIVLGILAKVAPQMNMFVIGMQLKVFVGLFILWVIVETIPTISDFIFTEMRSMMNDIIRAMMSS